MRRKNENAKDDQAAAQGADAEQEEGFNASHDEANFSDSEAGGSAASGAGNFADGESAENLLTVAAMQMEIEDLRRRAEEAEKRALYAQAEFQNYKRRMEDQSREAMKYATSDFIKNLLPALDNFERALKAAEQTKSVDALIGGVNGTLKQILAALQKAGVTPIESLGAEFDPAVHEAIGHTDSSEYPANTVAEEMQKGYMMHDRVLRPALVKVSAG